MKEEDKTWMSKLKLDFGLRVGRRRCAFVMKSRLMEKSNKLVILERVDLQ